MSPITTHVLDTSRGRPAAGIEVALQIRLGGEWKQVGNGATDVNGRCNTLMAVDGEIQAGTYRLLFGVGAYYRAEQTETFYSEIPIVFEIVRPEAHYHVPLSDQSVRVFDLSGKLSRAKKKAIPRANRK